MNLRRWRWPIASLVVLIGGSVLAAAVVPKK